MGVDTHRQRLKRFGRPLKKTRKRKIYRNKLTRHANAKMIYDIVLNHTSLTLTVPAGLSTAYTFSPSLSDVAGNDLTAFQNLYDEFKITGFTWMLKPRGNTTYATGSATPQLMGFQYYSVIDYSDLNNLANVNEALEYLNVKYHRSWKNAKRYIPAMCPQLIHDVNNNPMLNVVKPRWMQLATQTIGGISYNDTITAHIGCKIITEVNHNVYDQVFDFYIKVHCQFRNKK